MLDFEIYLVEEVITVPEAALLRANSTIPPVLITSRPNPDLVLRHNVNQSLLPIECKVSSFSSTSKKIKQANAILVCSGQDLANHFGLNNPSGWTSTTLYAVSHDQQADMERTLDILRAAIIGQGVATIDQPATALGISVEEDGIYVRFNDASRLPFATERDVLVMKLNVEQRPHLLYLIPVHPTVRSDDPAEDEYGHMVLSERLRSSLFMHIASQLEDGAVTISWDAVMADAILVWSQWGEEGKTNLLRPFKRFVR